MKYDKKQQAMYLFRELGNVDDELVADALNPRITHTPSVRWLMLAACFALSAVLVFGSVLAARLLSNQGDGGVLAPDVESIETPDKEFVSPTLDEMLVANRGTASYETVASVRELDFFANDVRVVWQYESSNTLCVSRPLTETESNTLLRYAKDGLDAGDDPREPTCRVWILLGDGRVISPYLHLSDGNVGYAELFAYATEVIPSNTFIACLSTILTQ